MASKAGAWLQGTRPFSFTGSLAPVILGAMLALKQNSFHPLYLLLSLAGMVLLHGGVNLLSDYDDYSNKVDTDESGGSSGVIGEKKLSPKSVLRGGALMMLLGCAAGIYLAVTRGWFILALGLVGALGGYSYTGKPLALKYKGLGAPMVFVYFGPLMLLGSYYVQTQSLSLSALFLSVPTGLLTTAILHANDMRDMVHDKKAGIRTFSLVIGERNAKSLYAGLLIFSYIAVILMSVLGIIPYWSLLCLITFPEALKCIKKVNREDAGGPYMDKTTAKLNGQFGIILILTILLPSVVK